VKHPRSLVAGFSLLGFILLGLFLLSDGALAQASAPKAGGAHVAPAASAKVSAEPNTTIASYGDWVLRCQRVEAEGKTTRVCEAAEAIQIQGQAAPIAQLAIGRLSPGEPLRITVVVPPAVTFPSSVRVDAKNGAPVTLEWRRCLPGGCFADAVLKDDVLARWRGLSDAGQLTFKDAAGKDVTLPLSFRGLSQALDALAKEGR
jgi:invasion protein IalB